MTNCGGLKATIKFDSNSFRPSFNHFANARFYRQGPLTDDTELDRYNGYYRSTGEFGIKALRGDAFALLYIPKNAAIHVGEIGDEASRLYLLNRLINGTGTSEEDPRRFSADCKAMLKHRANKAYIVGICNLQFTTTKVDQNSKSASLSKVYTDYGYSIYDSDFLYKTGEWVVAEDFEYLKDNECASGIHYFPSATGAAKYIYVDAYKPYLIRGTTFSGVVTQGYLKFSLCNEILTEWMNSVIQEFKKASDIFKHEHGFNVSLDDWDWIETMRTAIDDAINAIQTVHKVSSDTEPIAFVSTAQTYLRNDELATKELDKFNSKKNKPP